MRTVLFLDGPMKGKTVTEDINPSYKRIAIPHPRPFIPGEKSFPIPEMNSLEYDFIGHDGEGRILARLRSSN